MALTPLQKSNLEYVVKKLKAIKENIQDGDLNEALEELDWTTRCLEDTIAKDK